MVKDRKGTDGTVDTSKSEVLQGTLDLMILKTLLALGPLHGFGIARRIEQVSRDALPAQRGHGVHLVAPAATAGMDCGGMGHVEEQSQG